MTAEQELNRLLNEYCALRDRQFAVYTRFAKRHRLTTHELFVLDILWFAPEGCTQKEICERLSANKQTVGAIISRFHKKGFLIFEEVAEDKRNKRIRFTKSGKEYAKAIIPPAAEADNIAFSALGSDKAKELVLLTACLTDNMEKEFEKIKEN